MKLYNNYCTPGFSNSYVLGVDDAPASPDLAKREAIIIDPGAMDSETLANIENNNYSLEAILLTHDHTPHTAGLRSLKRIYDVEIYAASKSVLEYKSNIVRDGDIIHIGGSFTVQVFSVPGHSVDSVVYKIDNLLFTGDVLTAGLLGSTASSFGAMRQITTIQNKIFALSGDLIVLPGHGPPSTLNIERKFNVGIGLYQEKMSKSEKPNFWLNLLE
ncbi:MAG: MBL fold metallo-hydrolase [Spirochaetaceae bacterium]|jgi:glyoxylase-like metal-dependent hydrolase (beta-lactamase superfamily II)|nr:MBL fold metallo-hydrolase [Spirochaetaceae bacterium]